MSLDTLLTSYLIGLKLAQRGQARTCKFFGQASLHFMRETMRL